MQGTVFLISEGGGDTNCEIVKILYSYKINGTPRPGISLAVPWISSSLPWI